MRGWREKRSAQISHIQNTNMGDPGIEWLAKKGGLKDTSQEKK